MNIPRVLNAGDVECRVSKCTKDGVNLLLYKTARCDMQVLDETYGPMNWQRRHSRDNANCIISVWDSDKKQWVEKEDTGTESNTEAQKGLASDSFKRAGFNWGIGRELYTAPFIWIRAENCKLKDTGRKDKYNNPVYACNTKFYVSAMDVDEKTRRITYLVIAADNKVVYTFGGPKAEPKNKEAELLAEKALCRQSVKQYCQLHGADEKEAWQIIADTIGKPSKEFAKEDWQEGKRIVEAWGK